MDWLQAKDVGPNGKFHATMWVQPGPGCNYRPRALCAAPVILELDKGRKLDPYSYAHSKCRACIRKLEAEGMVYANEADTYGNDTQERHGGLPVGTRPVAKPSKREQLERRLERHRREAEVLEARVAELESLPSEPEVEDGEPNVIWFTKVFQNGHKAYTYAAVKSGDGLWYTTGPNVPKGFTWESLIEWVYDGESADVWHAVSYDPIS